MRALLVVVLAATPALAQTYYERTPAELPQTLDRNTPLIVVSPKPGAVHWGTNNWQHVTDTPLEGPGPDGNYRAKLGPFTGSHELDMALHNADGSWDSNGGRNYVAALADNVPVRRRPITIGQGPYLGKVGNVDYWEDLLDWELADCRGVSSPDNAKPFGDGDDFSRTILAFYSRHENGNLYLRVDFLDLGLGAETRGAVVLGFLMDWGAPNGQTYLPEFAQTKTSHPWQVALVVHNAQNAKAYDSQWNVKADQTSPLWKGASYRSDLDAVELGVSEDVLKMQGWDGKSAVRYQVYAMRENDNRLACGFQDPLTSGTLDRQVDDTTTGGTAKLATIIHGNQTVQQPQAVRELIDSTNTKTPAGNPTGYHRALDAHQIFRAPVNFHVSATLASTLEWAAPAFNDRIRGFLSNKPWLGRGAFLGGVLSEHILPYFEGAGGPNTEGARLNERMLQSLYGVPKPTVFWTPERVMKGTTLNDVKAAGYSFTVLDQVTHLHDWFGDDAQTGHKLNRISGVTCFAINDDVDAWKFANTDGGLWLSTRQILVQQALDQDQEKLTLVFDDWEAASGRSFTSFGVGNDNPDNYDRNIRWLAAHPWVQVVTLDEVASWGWKPVERGDRPDLAVDTYDWLRHATEKSYDHWFTGSNLEQDFSNTHPTILGSQTTQKAMGVLGRAGTILNDTWQDVGQLPSSELKNLAEAVYDCMSFETAWHDQTNNDYQPKLANGEYQDADTSFQNVSAWAAAVNGHAGDASLVAAAARWAASPPSTTRAWTQDVDQDGEEEILLASNTALCIFKKTGGRLVLAAARDPGTGSADLLVGSFLQGPGSNTARDQVETATSAVTRPPALCDWWATGGGGSRYVNATYTAQITGSSVKLTSDDGKIAKTISLSAGHLLVHYDSQAGDVYVRSALSPAPLALFAREGTIQESRPQGWTLVLSEQSNGRTASVTVGAGMNAAINDQASFGPDGNRSIAFTRQVEIHGTGTSFEVALDLSFTGK